ncbi:MAG: histidine phosphatase family protein [Rhodospirillaceae bacterium]|nr:histidine phosphatase family protein [Rhodospirillaceae bacterium]
MELNQKIYLFRHGETVWNKAKRLQGHKDTPLTLQGVKQAQAMGEKLSHVLKNIEPKFFFSSPIGRAHQTATIIADSINFNTESITLEKKLKEITFGDWDGLNMEEILLDYELIWQKRTKDKWTFAPPNGESYEVASARVERFLKEIPEEHPIIIVAHGSINKVIRGCWRDLEPNEVLKLDEPQNGFYELTSDRHERFIEV